MVAKRMRALYNCSADDAGELSFKEGDILVDVELSGEEGWYKGRIENTTLVGLFPFNYVQALPELQDDKSDRKNAITTNSHEAIPQKDKNTLSKQQTQKNFVGNNKPEDNQSPPIIGTKPKIIPSVNQNTNNRVNGNIGLDIQKLDNILTFEKPKLKSVSLNDQESLGMRVRSYSASSAHNNIENTEKILKPSQLLNGNGPKGALEIALSKGAPKSFPSARVNQFTKQANSGVNNGGIALVGMSRIKSNDDIHEEKDDFQNLKPSQIRQKQQLSSISPKPLASRSLTLSGPNANTLASNLKKKPSINTEISNLIPTNDSTPKLSAAGSKLDAFSPSSNPMPRLPSRPVSVASRRSRNSKNSPTPSTVTANSIKSTDLPPIRKTAEKIPPRIQKPKPQMPSTIVNDGASPVQPNLPPRPKARSTSNPPPLQPKPSEMSSIDILLNRNASKNQIDNNKSDKSPITVTASKSTTPPPITAKKPVLPSLQNTKSNSDTNIASKVKPVPNLPTRPPKGDQDSNIKSSALLNRARSATGPISNNNVPTSPIAHPVSRPIQSPSTTEKPTVVASSVRTAKIETNDSKNKKKAVQPPPPPPSRPPKSSLNNTKSNGQHVSKHRYDMLFDDIHDNGYVDGETIHFIWSKSKISNEDLARIWRECDPNQTGLLDRHSFFDGMSKVDELLSLKQQVM
ncbi:MAG: hypothetical protein EXX96DRAFT_478518 [Benjaminiella poitrasii]|nr:MAG: hypothetical protein EXX96DRAFT_478518 [Benjaminiella poitrasii]